MLETALQLKADNAMRRRHDDILPLRTLFMMFFNASLRTRNSFEAGIFQLGGHPTSITASPLSPLPTILITATPFFTPIVTSASIDLYSGSPRSFLPTEKDMPSSHTSLVGNTLFGAIGSKFGEGDYFSVAFKTSNKVQSNLMLVQYLSVVTSDLKNSNEVFGILSTVEFESINIQDARMMEKNIWYFGKASIYNLTYTVSI